MVQQGDGMVDQFGEPGWKGVLSAAGVGTPDWTVLGVKNKDLGYFCLKTRRFWHIPRPDSAHHPVRTDSGAHSIPPRTLCHATF